VSSRVNALKRLLANSHFSFFLPFIFAAAVLRLGLLLRADSLFYARPFIEDAYYCFSVARSLGHGTGLTVDGVHLPNGIQPLLVFLYAPFFTLFDDSAALRLCLGLNVIIECGLLSVVYFFIRNLRIRNNFHHEGESAGLVAVCLLLWSYSTTIFTLNGLETGLAVFLTLYTYHFYCKRFSHSTESRVGTSAFVGVLLGLTILARIDTAFFAVALAWYHLLHNDGSRWMKRMGDVVVMGLVAIALSFPWWYYNLVSFGHLTPTSGLSQRLVIPYTENATATLQLVMNALLLLGKLPYAQHLHLHHLLFFLVVTIAGGAILCIATLRQWMLKWYHDIRVNWNLHAFLPLTLFVLFLLLYYTLNFGAPHFLQRYLFLVHVLVICLVAIIIIELIQRVHYRYRPFVIWFSCVVVVGVYMIPYSWNFQKSKARENDFLEISQWITLHTTASESIGMGQSGTSGFFNRNVTNLDGKVNASVFQANSSGNMCAFLDSAQFTYLIDWQHFFNQYNACDLAREYVRIDSVGKFLIYKRKDTSSR